MTDIIIMFAIMIVLVALLGLFLGHHGHETEDVAAQDTLQKFAAETQANVRPVTVGELDELHRSITEPVAEAAKRRPGRPRKVTTANTQYKTH